METRSLGRGTWVWLEDDGTRTHIEGLLRVQTEVHARGEGWNSVVTPTRSHASRAAVIGSIMSQISATPASFRYSHTPS